MTHVIGVDIGGTKTRAGIVSETGQVIRAEQMATPATVGPDAVIQTCCEVVERLRASFEGAIRGVGVASAGRIDREGVVSFSTATFRDWKGTDLRTRIALRTGLSVVVENDANAAAVGEAWVGAAADCTPALFVALGTGVGGGLIERGRVVHGASGGAAEIGHLLYRAGERPCPCGHAGCFEPYLSVRNLADDYSRAVGRAVSGSEVFTRRFGNAAADTLVENWLRALASLVFSVHNAYDPGCVVIGGGVIESVGSWWNDFLAELAQLPVSVRVRPARLGSDAAVVGAARLAWLDIIAKEGRGWE